MEHTELSPASSVAPEPPRPAKRQTKKKPLNDSRLSSIKPAPPGQREKHKTRARGLYLLVDDADGRWWRFRIQVDGAEKHYALGIYPGVSLAEAEERAAKLRVRRQNGAGAAELAYLAAELSGRKQPHRSAIVKSAPAGSSFNDIADSWWAYRRKHGSPRTGRPLAASTLDSDERAFNYLVRELGERAKGPMAAIEFDEIRAAVVRIMDSATINGGSHATAKRAMKLLKQFWKWARTHHSKVVTTNPVVEYTATDVVGRREPEHHASIKAPEPFGKLLNAIDGYFGQPVVRIGLQVLALTFVRPGELRLAMWSEFDLDSAEPTWTIPKERMKMRKGQHLVPLARQTVALLRELKEHKRGELAFPSLRPGQPLSDNTFNAALRTLGYPGSVHVSHGFRASARTMLREQYKFPGDVIEVQLAHAKPGLGNTYDRAEYLDERRVMMQAWADRIDEMRQQQNS